MIRPLIALALLSITLVLSNCQTNQHASEHPIYSVDAQGNTIITNPSASLQAAPEESSPMNTPVIKDIAEDIGKSVGSTRYNP